MAVAEGRAAPDRAPRLGPRGGIQSMPTYSSAEGIPIRAGDRYAITATYNNSYLNTFISDSFNIMGVLQNLFIVNAILPVAH